MSEQEKERQTIYDLLNSETKSKILCLQKKKKKKKKKNNKLLKKTFERKGGVENWTKTKGRPFKCS